MKPTFDEIYRNAPAERRDQLLRFRAAHPYKHLAVGGVQWDYIASGQGAQAIVILSGGISTGESSFSTMTKLEKEYRVISPSYPPTGKLDVVTDGLAALLDAEGIEKAHVYGHSLGSLVGHVLVRRHPQKVDKLILGSFGLYTMAHVLAAKLFFKLPMRVLYAYYARALRRLTAGTGDDEQRFMAAYMSDLFYLQHTLSTFMSQMGLLLDGSDHAAEYGIFTPVERPGRVLIIVADDDHGFSQKERAMLIAAYPGAQVKRFATGGHWVGTTHPEEYDAAFDAFLKA